MFNDVIVGVDELVGGFNAVALARELSAAGGQAHVGLRLRDGEGRMQS
jgi:hypothetical protein